MAIQGDIRDLDLVSLISTAAFRTGVIDVTCEPLGSVVIYFKDGKIISVLRNGEILENFVEILDTFITLIRCRKGTFMMENLEEADVEIPKTLSIDANHLILWVSSLIDEINSTQLGVDDDTFVRINVGEAKKLSDTLDISFTLLVIPYLVHGITVRELRKLVPLRDDLLDYFLAKLIGKGVIEVAERKPEQRSIRVYIDVPDENLSSLILSELRKRGYEPQTNLDGKIKDPYEAQILFVDITGRGFLWANTLYGPYASRTVLIGKEELKPKRFFYLKKEHLNGEALSKILETLGL